MEQVKETEDGCALLEKHMSMMIEGRVNAHTKTMLLEQKDSDVAFRAENVVFRVHKMILAVNSRVFAAHFSSNFKEEDMHRVHPDIGAETFAQLLVYIYFKNVCADTLVEQLELLKAATYYWITDLVDYCREQLLSAEIKTRSTAIYMLRVAKQLADEELRAKCLTALCNDINQTGNSLLLEDDFLSLTSDDVIDVLKMHSLDATECQLFMAVLKWAKAHNIKGEPAYVIMAPFVPYIFFQQMTLDEIVHFVHPSYALPPEADYNVLSMAAANYTKECAKALGVSPGSLCKSKSRKDGGICYNFPKSAPPSNTSLHVRGTVSSTRRASSWKCF